MMDFNLTEVGGVFTSLREAITGEKIADPVKRAEIALKMDVLEAGLKKAQIAVNETEARHASVFVAGWRPFIGWVGGFALTYNYIVQPLLSIVLQANGVTVVMPSLDIMNLMVLMTGMLGFGGFRTFEKMKGKSSGE